MGQGKRPRALAAGVLTERLCPTCGKQVPFNCHYCSVACRPSAHGSGLCKGCGKPNPHAATRATCSRACVTVALRRAHQHPRKHFAPKKPLICAWCARAWTPTARQINRALVGNQSFKYCSRDCYFQYKKSQTSVSCVTCGKAVEVSILSAAGKGQIDVRCGSCLTQARLKVCHVCGTESVNALCSEPCRAVWSRYQSLTQARKSCTPIGPRICRNCGQSFEGFQSTKYCCLSCRKSGTQWLLKWVKRWGLKSIRDLSDETIDQLRALRAVHRVIQGRGEPVYKHEGERRYGFNAENLLRPNRRG